ncbi:MAG: hypothetical protein K1X91_09700, partial [Bacteriodetes bacterium]|nr:hypothetical protein [Bacteroidota bacterium]
MNPMLPKLRLFVMLVIIAVSGIVSTGKLHAQCQPVWQYGVMAITNFSLSDGSTTIISRASQTDIAPTCSTFTTPITNGAFATGVSGNVSLGKTYTYSILGGNYYCGSLYPFGWAIWIDLNGDGNFAGTAERVAVNSCNSYSNGGTPATGTFTLPCSANSGTLKMRVMACYNYNYNTALYCSAQYGFQPDDACGAYWYGEAEDYTLNVLGDMGPTFPSNTAPNNLLSIGTVYSGTSGGYVNCTLAAPTTGYVTYRIVGPLPSTNSVYVALNPSNSNDTLVPCSGTGTFNQYFSNARGIYSGTAGAIDLSKGNVTPGAYRLEASFVKSSGCSSFVAKNFYIPLAWDLSISKIIGPASNQSPQFYKYPRGVPIQLSARMQNVGQYAVTAARMYCEIKNPSGQVVYLDTVNYSSASGLLTGDEIGSDGIDGGFVNFSTLQVGVYQVRYWCDLLNGSDQQLSNNQLPAANSTYTFEVQYDTELSVDAFIRPTSGSTDVYVGRPIQPIIRIKNNGLADVSDIPATMVITRNGIEVYRQSIVIPDVSRGQSTSVVVPFWTPQQTGSHRICMYLELQDDAIRSNDSLCIDVNVGESLSGTYTIGTLNNGQPRNFTTIEDAVTALYGQGVSGPVTFELTDANYTVGNAVANVPALDFTSKIAGVSSVNTVTFKPALIKSLSRSSVAVRLRTGNGQGILFGQSYFPGNAKAIQNTKPSPENARPTGYITFDGGDQRSFRFMLDVALATPTSMPHRSVFYLSDGASNITIKNCLIENFPQSTASYAANLPIPKYVSPNFTFESDTRQLTSGPDSYSAGIVSRSKVPSIGGNNALALDTLSNDNNKFISNEISGF